MSVSESDLLQVRADNRIELSISGVMLNYFFVCHRKLWYFANHVTMEQESDLVAMGRLIHETSYERDQKEMLLDGRIRLDRVTADGLIHEVKKSDKMEEAHIWQIKYYLWVLKRRGVWPLQGKIDYPRLRQTVDIQLTPEDEAQIDRTLAHLREIVGMPTPPRVEKKSFCRRCSYYELCFS
jgi:CRISPR-associated exonuclease Cas4